MKISELAKPQVNIFRTIQKYEEFNNPVNYVVLNLFIFLFLFFILVKIINYTPPFLTKEFFSHASNFCIGFFGTSCVLSLYKILSFRYFKNKLSEFLNDSFWHPVNSKSLYHKTMTSIELPENSKKNYNSSYYKESINKFFTERNIDNIDTLTLKIILQLLLEQEFKNSENVLDTEQKLQNFQFFKKS